MKRKTLADVNEILADILAQNKAERKGYQDKKNDAQVAKQKATEEAIEAFSKADMQLYHQAQDAIRTAEDAIKMYEGLIAETDSKPLIDRDTYTTLKAEIIAALDCTVEDFDKETEAVIEAQEARADKFYDTIRQGNEMLETLCNHLLRPSNYAEMADGRRVLVKKNITYNNPSSVGLIDYLTGSSFYKERHPKATEDTHSWISRG